MERFHHVLHDHHLFMIVFIIVGSCYHCTGEMQVLTDSNWTAVLQGDWFVEFYAPWCGACRSFEPIWQQFSEQSDSLGVKIAKADITVESGLAARFLVSQLPTLYYINEEGTSFRKYTGKRRIDNLEKFVNEKQWQQIEPVVWYLKPNSVPMTVAGALAGIGESVRFLVQILTDQYSVPMWLIIVGMVVATIVVGVIMGLVLVGIGGVIFPAKRQQPPRGTPQKAVTAVGKEVESESTAAGGDTKKDK
ncbi:thioredoxin-related transmembrane protein 1-like [Symsagittifera roscoffensis]|uniref:thioredoxin-related transmembrane protein 1-like n=1 Tax=Symsagittifera roscoffensis TaxID=84072 RepID=UPI00307C0266